MARTKRKSSFHRGGKSKKILKGGAGKQKEEINPLTPTQATTEIRSKIEKILDTTPFPEPDFQQITEPYEKGKLIGRVTSEVYMR